MHHISGSGLALIKRYEGFSSRPYQLGDGVTTIGYGETHGITMRTPPWTEAYASKRLRKRVRRDYEPYVHRLGLPLNQNQFDALVSAIYNLGPGILERGRSLGDALRTKRDAGYNERVGNALRLYSMPGTQFHEGLLRRRNEEARLFACLDREQRKVKRWETELAKIRLAVRRIGHWTPKRKERAAELRRAIERTHRTARRK